MGKIGSFQKENRQEKNVKLIKMNSDKKGIVKIRLKGYLCIFYSYLTINF